MNESSFRIVAIVVLVIVVGGAIGALYPQSDFFGIILVPYEPWMSAALYLILNFILSLLTVGGLALAGLLISQRFHCPNLWIERIGVIRRLALPGALGLLLCAFTCQLAARSGLLVVDQSMLQRFFVLTLVSVLLWACLLQIVLVLFLVPFTAGLLHLFVIPRRLKRDAYWFGAALLAVMITILILGKAGWPRPVPLFFACFCGTIFLSATFMKTAGFLASLSFGMAGALGGVLWTALA